MPKPLIAAALSLVLITGGIIAALDVHYTPPREDSLFPLEKEEPSVLVDTDRIPILLYHNIDGGGPFSVSSSTIRKHFSYLRDNDIEVISLQQLLAMQNKGEHSDRKRCVITVDDGYLSSYTKLLPLAHEFNFPITLFVYTDFIYKSSTNKMTWEKLRELDAHGIDIQCHTISHADLEKLVNQGTREAYNRLYRELALSKKILEVRLNKKIQYIAFPYGRYNRRLNDIARDLGYSRTFSTDYGANISSYYTYCLNRHHIKRDYTVKTIQKILDMR